MQTEKHTYIQTSTQPNAARFARIYTHTLTLTNKQTGKHTHIYTDIYRGRQINKETEAGRQTATERKTSTHRYKQY